VLVLLCCSVMLLSVSGQITTNAPETPVNTNAASTEVSLPEPAAPRGTARLLNLQKKAEERDQMAEKCALLEEELVMLQQQLWIRWNVRRRSLSN